MIHRRAENLTDKKRSPMPGIFFFSTTIFISAFLLFQIQPLISRYILPWFGGTPAVWSVSLLFFQSLLLAGYAYADWLAGNTEGRPRRRLQFHLLLLASSGLFILVSRLLWGAPLLPDATWKPPDAALPVLRILSLLLVSVGLPYFLLAGTSPLIQAWFKVLIPERSPYRLYALSNLGSLLGLLSYPFLFEPLLSLQQQATIWAAGFWIYIGLGAFLTLQVLRGGRAQAAPSGMSPQPLTTTPEKIFAPRNGEKNYSGLPPSLGQRLAWVAFPACATLLLLAVTNQLTQEVAVIPFLWVLPLSLYLLSFSLAFSGERWYQRGRALLLLGIASTLLAYAILRFSSLGVFIQISAFGFFLFIATLVLHAELYRLRPEPRYLTQFYLLVALGGALGGLFVNLAAPVIFRGYWELHLGTLLLYLFLLTLYISDGSLRRLGRRLFMAAPLAALVLGLSGYVLVYNIRATMAGVVAMERNFYGVLRVRALAAGEPTREARGLSHGITSHGFQFIEPDLRRTPTTYYAQGSGIGLTLAHYAEAVDDPTPGLRVGVIGLGTGTLAAYAQPGDTYRFYEINPNILELAAGAGGYFSYLSEAPGEIQLVAGDARLSLEQELGSGQAQGFDVLALDAFSSDSIPVHLLTVEAFELYLQHLQPRGVLAVHISNRYLDLEPLVRALGEHFELESAVIASPRTDLGAYPAVWVLLERETEGGTALLTHREIASRRQPALELQPPVRLWTDDYSNLLQVVRKNVFFRLR